MGKIFLRNRRAVVPAVVVAFASCFASVNAIAATDDDDPPWPLPGVSFYGDPSVPDISGLWLGTPMGVPGGRAQTNTGSSSDGRPPTYWAPWPLPYTPEYQKISDERVEATKRGVALGDTGGKCLPFGTPQLLVLKVYADEFVQTPGAVTIFRWGSLPLVIWTDGRGHPRDLAPSYNGHSIGYWAGDTLFVDTAGIRGDTPLDGMRNPHSAKLHIKSTIQRVAKDVIHFHVTLYDEDAFTEPVAMTDIYHRKGSRWQVWDDASCFENNKSLSPGASSPGGFIKF